MAPLFIVPARADSGYSTYEQVVTADGYVAKNGAVYTNQDTNDLYAQNDAGIISRTWMRWDVSTIPNTAYITRITLKYDGESATPGVLAILTNMTSDPNGLTAQQRYDGVASGNTLYTSAATWATGNNQEVVIAADHDADCTGFQTALANGQDWFALGFKLVLENVGNLIRLQASNDATATPKPTLHIEYYTATPSVIYLGGPYYENNTLVATPTPVTVVADAWTESFNLLNGNQTLFSSSTASYITWEVSAGIYRRIYIYQDNVTLNLYNPEDTFTAFGFTVKDFTGETESGTIYFETRRVIGGTERIIERVPVLHTINLITMTLVENRNYVVQFTVGATVYQYSFFSSPLDTTPVIVLNEITFSRTIQLSGTYIHVDADRPTATSLRVNYTNTRADTNLVQIAVREMDGTLVGGANIASDAFTYTYTPVDNETSYYFDLAIDTDLWDPTWKKTLPWEPVFVGLPDPFTVLGTVGGLDTSRIMGFAFIIFTALLFSAKDVTIGCFSVAITTSLMSYWGFFPVDNTILALVVGLSVMVGLGLRGR